MISDEVVSLCAVMYRTAADRRRRPFQTRPSSRIGFVSPVEPRVREDLSEIPPAAHRAEASPTGTSPRVFPERRHHLPSMPGLGTRWRSIGEPSPLSSRLGGYRSDLQAEKQPTAPRIAEGTPATLSTIACLRRKTTRSDRSNNRPRTLFGPAGLDGRRDPSRRLPQGRALRHRRSR